MHKIMEMIKHFLDGIKKSINDQITDSVTQTKKKK